MVYLGLPNFKMVDLSMANCECHNQMVSLKQLRWWSWSHMLCSTAKISPTTSPQKSFFFFLIGDLPDFGASTSQHLLIPIKMWVEQCHKPPMTGNGNHTTYKNGDFSGGWYVIVLATSTDTFSRWKVPTKWGVEGPQSSSLVFCEQVRRRWSNGNWYPVVKLGKLGNAL